MFYLKKKHINNSIMLKLFIISILLINSIFWGFYPKNSMSPHQKLLDMIGLQIKANSFFHLFIGLFFYLIAFMVSHEIIY